MSPIEIKPTTALEPREVELLEMIANPSLKEWAQKWQPKSGRSGARVFVALALLKDKTGTLDSLRKAISLNPRWRETAKANPDLQPFLNDPDFATLLGR
jgi:aryl carrier-like protein